MPKNKKIILIVLFFLGLLGFLSYLSEGTSKNEITPVLENITSNPIGKTYGVYGVKTVLEINDIKYESEIAGEISVYDFMDKLRNEGKINFTEKNYTGIGKFIVTINGIKNSGDQNWIYYVNGKKAQVGVSNYQIKPGDVVSWKYEKNY